MRYAHIFCGWSKRLKLNGSSRCPERARHIDGTRRQLGGYDRQEHAGPLYSEQGTGRSTLMITLATWIGIAGLVAVSLESPVVTLVLFGIAVYLIGGA
jgi:hypothetical protein